MASSETEGVPALIKSRIRAYLLSCTNHQEPLHTFEANFSKVYKAVKPKEYGFSSILKMMESIPDAVQISNKCGQIIFIGLPLEANKHIVNMIDKQKKPKKSKGRRDIGIFPRYQHTGFRPFRPTHIPRNAINHPPSNQFRSHPSQTSQIPKPQCSPLMSYPPSNIKKTSQVTKPVTNQKPCYANNNTSKYQNSTPLSANATSVHMISQQASSVLYTNKENQQTLPSKNLWNRSGLVTYQSEIESSQEKKVSVFDRLGPRSVSSRNSNSTKAKTNCEPCQDDGRSVFVLGPEIKQQSNKSIESLRQLNVTSSHRKSLDSRPNNSETKSNHVLGSRSTSVSESRIPPASESLSAPVSPSVTTEVYVDLKGTESTQESNIDYEGQMFSCDDSDFLKRLVRYLLATLENPEDRIFTAAGITSRMQRQLARNSIDIPVYMTSIIYEFLTSSWDDCFINVDEEDSQETAEFRFTDEVRNAYRYPVKKLPEQTPLSLKTMVNVKVKYVSSPAFYVSLCSEKIIKKYNDMTQKLKDFIEGDEPEEIFTYRANELCAVYIQTSNRFMRGRLQSFKIKASQADQSTIQLSLVAVMFLVDTGELVTIPASDVYALPKYLRIIPPFAYRCIFSGARVTDQERFQSVMNSHIDKEIQLTVDVQQKSVDGLVLQGRLYESSYVMDDLVSSSIMSKVTISEPEPKPFPTNKDSRVRFVDWHQGYRTVLVQRWSDEELQQLDCLEKQLGSLLLTKNMNVLRTLTDNFYVWLLPNGTGRRVRCRSELRVQCLDHGCLCDVDRIETLFFPDDEKLITAFSKLPYMATSLPLAMVPDYQGEKDVLSNRNSKELKTKIRRICPTHSILQIRHSTLVSESPAFILKYEQSDDKPSVNIQFAKLFMDMKNWPVGQRFCASVIPIDRETVKKMEGDWYRYIVRFDKDGCCPHFGIPLQDYRFMERCCFSFTSKMPNGKSLMTPLSDLSASEIVDVQTRLVLLLSQDEIDGSSPRAVRVILTQPYLSSHSGQVNICLVDNPMDYVYSAEPNQIFTFPKSSRQECHYKKYIDIDDFEINLFRELLQNLPPLDQIILTSSPLTCDSQPHQLEIDAFVTDLCLPLVKAIT